MPVHHARTLAAATAGIVAALAPGPAVAQDAARTATPELPAVEVVGRRQSGAYHAEEASGTKSDLPLRELPQAVRVMSRQTLDDLGAVRLDDAFDYVGGVSRQNNFGGLWDNIAIRGLSGDVNNGMPVLINGFAGNRGFNAPRDAAAVERIEFLKGPAASLYGVTEPGGTLNIVTKKPLWKSAHALEAYVGSFGLFRTQIDSTGPLTPGLAYRLNAAIETRDGFRDHVDAERVMVAPALTWKLSSSSTLYYNGELLRHRTPLDRGVVAVGNRLGAIPRERFLGEPADGRVTVDNQTHQLVLEHDLNRDWSTRVGVSYKGGSLSGYSTEPQPTLQADERTLRRQRRYRNYDSDDLSLQAELKGRIRTGAIEHELLVGTEAYRFSIDQLLLRVNPTAAAPYAIDVFNPVYGQVQPAPLPNTDTHELQDGLAVYLQDVISVGPRWRLVAGLRADRFDQSVNNRRTGVVTRQAPGAVSPRAGISFLASDRWTVFANTGRSFRPNSGTGAAGQPFDPEHGRSVEGGLKWEAAARNLGATLSVFDIRKKNMLTTDPANAAFSVASGEVQSKGFELDLSGQISQRWRLNASLSYHDVSVLRDNSLEVGGRLLNVPKVNASVLAVYEAPAGDSGRYGIGGGLTHTGVRLGEARTQAQANAGTAPFELPAYTVAKVLAYWRISPTLRVSLDIDNLFDRTYYTSSFQRTWVTPGAPRTIMAGVQAKF